MKVTFGVNGETTTRDVDPSRRLLSLLNEELGVVSARESCGIGRCGACVVLLDGRPVNACLVLAGKLDGTTVTTVEGLGPPAANVQRALAEAGAVQCGYCAPGLVVTLSWLVAEGLVDRDAGEIEALLSGQICRCTGYGGLRRALALLQE